MICVGIIGTGIGAEHLQAYLELPEQYRVLVLCDLDTDRAARVRGDNSDIALETDIDKVLGNPDIDLIDVCLPPHLHYEISLKALKAGKHVVCEKPLVNSLRDADALAQQAKKSGKTLTPVFQYRYGLATAKLRALIDAGLTGKPFVASIETHWNRMSDYYAVSWRGTWAGEQGGAVLGHAIHNHDLLCAFFGPVKKLSAMTATRVNDIETEDCVAISFQMENGALATSSITLGASTDTTRIRFCFEHLTAESGRLPYAPASDLWTFSARGDSNQEAVDDCIKNITTEESGFVGFFSALADALEGRGGNEVTIDDGRRSLELVSAIYYAAQNDVVVELPLDEYFKYYSGWSPE